MRRAASAMLARSWACGMTSRGWCAFWEALGYALADDVQLHTVNPLTPPPTFMRKWFRDCQLAVLRRVTVGSALRGRAA